MANLLQRLPLPAELAEKYPSKSVTIRWQNRLQMQLRLAKSCSPRAYGCIQLGHVRSGMQLCAVRHFVRPWVLLAWHSFPSPRKLGRHATARHAHQAVSGSQPAQEAQLCGRSGLT